MERPPPSPLPDAAKLRFAGFTLDLDQRLLLRPDGSPAELRPQVYEVLQLLARHAGQLVSKADLMDAVWPGVVVTDDSLVQAISDLRQAIGAAGHGVIRTVPRRGYVLVANAEQRVDKNDAIGGIEGADSKELAGSREAARPQNQRKLRFNWKSVSVAGLVLATVVAIGYVNADIPTNADSSRPGIAVLPFAGPPNDAEGDAVGRAIAGDLVSELARSPDLRVISSQSSFQLKAAATPLDEIGRRLHSRYLVDGSVKREGESLRLKITLLDSQGGQVLWTVLPLVDRTTLATKERELVSRVAGTLQSRVSRIEQSRALVEPPKTLEVFVLTARAKSMMQRYNAEGMRESRRLLGQALAVDPNYALAWALLGITNVVDSGLQLTGEWNVRRGDEFLAQIQRAISLQPDLPIAYVALSDAQGLLQNFDAALAAGEHCHASSPNDAACFYAIGSAQLRLGLARAAVHNLEQALERNPLPPANQVAFYGTALWADRQLEEAVRVAGDCLAKAPDFSRCRQDRIVALVELGRAAEANEEAARLRLQFPKITAQNFQLAFAANKEASDLQNRRIAAAVRGGFPLSSSKSTAAGEGAGR